MHLVVRLDSNKVAKFKKSLDPIPGLMRAYNLPGQTIEVDCGVVVSDSLGKMVGLKIDLASGCWEYSVDGNWIAI